jgi:hypothetical protein
MSHVEVPLAQVRQELEKLGFRDLPEHLLVSFMQSILNEEAVATAMSGPCMNAPSDINEAKETNFLRSNGAISTQSASATFAAAALKTRVSGRKVTILSPSKCAHSAFRQSETQEDQRSLPLGQLQQRDAVCQEQQRKPNTTVVEERRTSSDHTLQSGVQGSSKSRHGVHQKSGQEPQIHTVPSAHIPQSESASSAASNISSPPHFFSDENSVPASERLEAANNALRAAISCKSSSLRAHSSSSSVIFASTGLTRPRSKHDPVKAFQNHVSLLSCMFASVIHRCPHNFSFRFPSTVGRMGFHSSLAAIVCWPGRRTTLCSRPAFAAVVASHHL